MTLVEAMRILGGYEPGMRNEIEMVYSLAEFDASNKCGEFVLADIQRFSLVRGAEMRDFRMGSAERSSRQGLDDLHNSALLERGERLKIASKWGTYPDMKAGCRTA